MKKTKAVFSKFHVKISFIFFFLLFSVNAFSAPVKNQAVTIIQPDGEKIECFVSGDEFFNRLHDIDGYTIIQAPDGYYYYAELSNDIIVPSKYKVNSVNPSKVGLVPNVVISHTNYDNRVKSKSIGLNNTPLEPENFSTSGVINNIVIYIRFAGDAEISTTRNEYDEKLSSTSTPSLKSYFLETSYNKLTINSTHYPECSNPTTSNSSYQDLHPREYFMPYNATTNLIGYQTESDKTTREHRLLADAINWININSPVPTGINIDADNDGKVDNVTFIIKGNSNGWSDLLWAHKWALYSFDVRLNTKRVYTYTFQPENQVSIRTLCHEMFHSIGAPDLYHYDTDYMNPVGNWDLMEYGSGHMGAYMKWKYSGYSWITSIPEITQSGTYTLQPLSSSTNNCYRITSPSSNGEFFVVEYRKKEGNFESNLPGSGLVIYRINPSLNGNRNGPPDEVYIYRPNGTTSVNGTYNSGYFSSESGRTIFNDFTNPASFLGNGDLGGLDISNITSAGSSISFTVTIGNSNLKRVTGLVNPTTGGTILGSGGYAIDSECTLEARANNGYSFVNWTNQNGGNIVSTNANYTFTVNDNITLIANFSLNNTINCSDAVILTLGQTYNGTTSGVSSTNTYSCSTWNESGPEKIFKITTTSTTNLTAALSNLDNDLDVFILSSCSPNGCLKSGDNIAVYNSAPAGEYYIIVDGYGGDEGDFSLKVYNAQLFTISATCSPTEGGTVTGTGTFNGGSVITLKATPASGYTFTYWSENGVQVSTNQSYILDVNASHNFVANFVSGLDCINAINLSLGDSYTGTTSGFSRNNNYSGTTWNESGPEKIFKVTLTTAGDLSASLSNLSSDLDVFILSDCNPLHCLAYGDTKASLTNTAAGTYYIVVDGYNGNLGTFTLTVTGNSTVYSVTTISYPSDGGTTSGGGSFSPGTSITVRATAATNKTFVNWTNYLGTTVSTNANYTFTVSGNINLTANFISNSYCSGTTTLTAAQGDFDDGSGTNYYLPNSDCYWLIQPNNATSIDLTFISMNLESCCDYVKIYNGSTTSDPLIGTYKTLPINIRSTGGSLLVHFVSDLSIQLSGWSATYVAQIQPSYNITTSTNNTGGTCTDGGTFLSGENVMLVATPDNGYTFINWTENGTVVSTNASYEFTAYSNRNLVANFSINTFNVNVSSNIGGTTSGSGTYNYNQSVTITATPESGYKFINWIENENEISRNNIFIFNILENRNFIANFETDTKLKNIFDNNSISIFPNPNQGKFSIDINNSYYGELTISIHSIIGNLEKEITVNKTTDQLIYSIDMGNAPNGAYLISLQTNTYKIVKIIIIN